MSWLGRIVALALLMVPLTTSVESSRVVHANGSKALATLSVLATPVMVEGQAGSAPADDGQIVSLGDQIWTGESGIALLTFFDGSETQLQGNTQIVLEAPPGQPTESGVSVFLSAGTTVTHVQRLAAGTNFRTDTPSAVAMVRGTTYVVTATPMELAEAGSLDGDDDLAQVDGTSEEPTVARPTSCTRDNPAGCVTSVVLLADPDGHLGQVEVASNIAGPARPPNLRLTSHGDSAHVSNVGAVRQQPKPEQLAKLNQAALQRRDVARAAAAQRAAQNVLRSGVRRPDPRPVTPPAARPVSPLPRPRP